MTPLYRFSLGAHPPVLQASDGEIIEIDLPDADGLGRDLRSLPKRLFEAPFLGNPVYGPIHVAGAHPGDALEVEFLEFALNPTGRTLLAPHHGFLPDHLLGGAAPGSAAPPTPRHMYRWKISQKYAQLENPLGKKTIRVPLRPFLGCIGTAPPGSQRLSSLLAANHGGNMDHPDLTQGSKLFLPVHVDGALLHLGDLHAAQGHGEVVGGGIEASGRVRFRLRLKKNHPLGCLRYQTLSGFGSLAVQGSFEAAARHALADVVDSLHNQGWNRYDAYAAVSQCCEFRPGGLTETYSVVSCFIPLSAVAMK